MTGMWRPSWSSAERPVGVAKYHGPGCLTYCPRQEFQRFEAQVRTYASCAEAEAAGEIIAKCCKNRNEEPT